MRTFGWTPTEGELQVQILQLYRGASQQISLFTALQGDQPTNQSFYSFTGGPVNKSVFLQLYGDQTTNQSFYSFTGEPVNKSVILQLCRANKSVFYSFTGGQSINEFFYDNFTGGIIFLQLYGGTSQQISLLLRHSALVNKSVFIVSKQINETIII